ncbi:MAG: hypothetical protein OEZ10_14510 [Gammaproteobacteria bacterium]|nr:hypothetical protein [Gammaproteobacteria bacterium]
MDNISNAGKWPRILFFLFQLVLLAGAGLGAMMFRAPEQAMHTGFYLAVATALVLVLYAWFRIHPRSAPLKGEAFYLFLSGVIVTSLPLLYYLATGGFGLYKIVQFRLFESGASITAYEESPVNLPGFAQPVGVKMTLTLSHSVNPGGWIRNPRIVIAGSSPLDGTGKTEPDGKAGSSIPAEAYWDFCQAPIVEGAGCFTQPIWPIRDYPVLSDSGTTVLSYEIYPSNLYYVDEKRTRICLRSRAPYEGVTPVGGLVVHWHLAYNEQLLNIAGLLEDRIREQSAFFRNTEGIKWSYSSLQSEDVIQAGYQPCAAMDAIRFSEETECYCRGGAISTASDKSSAQ